VSGRRASVVNVAGLPENDRRWQAVLARDAGYDGAMVFGVRTTGIYCRPSCPARRPRRDNVVFFPRPEAAEGAGFRACRRCRPRTVSPAQDRTAWVTEACRRLSSHEGGPVRLADLGAELGLSPYHLQRTFKRLMGITPRQYADAVRQGLFRARLRKGGDVTQAVYDAGYGSSSRAYEGAAARLGMTPGAYRKGGRGMRIAYTVVGSPLGRLLVAATERGISAVSLGDADAPVEAALREEYPDAELRRDDDAMRPWLTGVLQRIEGVAPDATLPTDIRATAFQRRVWEELKEIPRGQTRSYAEIARRIGRPTAVRAVARACATNPVALVIPCHRVVAREGGLSGYRWGVERKRSLLEREAASVSPAADAGAAARPGERPRPGRRTRR
jgi:AraC family transcriptional regulator, regulatory protein of adaptative response / methylated-DNA-[protein]-cysteine methyltransferase